MMADSRTFEVETSVTLDYRKKHWGLERIVLDGISNHLPADSGGNHTHVKLKQKGVWVDLKNVDPSVETTEVMFEDDGKGYPSHKLSTLRSTKGADVLSVGQFGEGLKLVAAAALRENIQLQYRSRNWWAQPFSKPEADDGDSYERLCFRITENGDNIFGSRTVFFNPTADLVAEVLKLPSKVLALNDIYRELHNEKDNFDVTGYEKYFRIIPSLSDFGIEDKKINYTMPEGGFKFDLSAFKFPVRYHSRIIDLGEDEKAIFVKGIRVQSSRSLFSYDLGIEDINPDRVYANQGVILDEIEALLKGCTNEEVLTNLLKAAEKNPHADYQEFQAMNPGRKIKSKRSLDHLIEKSSPPNDIVKQFFDTINPWVTTFRTLYGEKAVIADDNTTINSDAEIMGFKPVRLNPGIEKHLQGLGIENAHQIVTGTKEYKWVALSDLTEQEQAMYNLIPGLNDVVFGSETAIPQDKVRIYSGMFFPSGREAESDLGVTITEKDGTKYIGIKRSVLSDEQEFVTTYFHEAGHFVTRQADHTRGHTDFGYALLGKLALREVRREKA